MSREQEIAAQTAIRRALLRNGYTPLANNDKRCMLPGWPTLPVDEALIDEWSEAWRYRATGVRLDDGLVMIDFDIDDAEAVQAVIDALPDDLWAVFEGCPVRRGKGAKEAWFARVAQPFPRWASAAWWRPGEGGSDEAPMHRLEVFGGASARQAGVYGAHTIAPSGEVAVAYRWDGPGLVETPLAALPLVTEAQIEQLCRVVNEVLAARRWTRVATVREGRTEAGEVFDLTDDMVFVTTEGEMSLGELRDRVAAGAIRLSASWLEGDSAVNLTRCIASARHDGALVVLETADHVLHRPVEDEPGRSVAPGSRGLARLAAMRAAQGMGAGLAGGGAGEGGEGGGGDEAGGEAEAPEAPPVGAEEVLEQLVAGMCEALVFVPSDSRCVAELGAGPGQAMTLANARHKFASLSVPFVGKRGAVTEVNPLDAWLKDERRIDVAGWRFAPETEDRLVMVDGHWWQNLYAGPPVYGSDPWGLEDWLTFMAHLVPDRDEREWFFNWLAARVQRPWQPNCGVLMISAVHGTGRGTLFDFLSGVVGARYTAPVEADVLLGNGGQGQYTEWLEGALLVICEEILVAGGDGGSMAWKRQIGYEKLKARMDPRARDIQIVCKGRPNYRGRVYAGYLLATNNETALPLLDGDRRVAVLQGPEVSLMDSGAAREAIDRLRVPDGGAGFQDGPLRAVREWLLAREVDWSDAREAPMTAGKRAMIDANEGDLEEALEEVLAALPGEFCTNRALRERLGRKLTALGIRDEIKNWWVRAQDELRQRPGRFGWSRMPVRQKIGAEGKTRATVYYLGGEGRKDRLAQWQAASWGDREGLLAAADDPARVASRVAQLMRDRGLTVHESAPEEGDT